MTERARDVTHWLKALAAKPADLSGSSETLVIESKD